MPRSHSSQNLPTWAVIMQIILSTNTERHRFQTTPVQAQHLSISILPNNLATLPNTDLLSYRTARGEPGLCPAVSALPAGLQALSGCASWPGRTERERFAGSKAAAARAERRHPPHTDEHARGNHRSSWAPHRHRGPRRAPRSAPLPPAPPNLRNLLQSPISNAASTSSGLKGSFCHRDRDNTKTFPAGCHTRLAGPLFLPDAAGPGQGQDRHRDPLPSGRARHSHSHTESGGGANRGRGTERHREPPARRSPAAQHRHRLEDLVPLEHGAVALTDARARAALHGRRRRSCRAPRRRRSLAGGAAAGAHARCGSAGGGSRQPALRAAGARPAPGLLRAFPALCWGR